MDLESYLAKIFDFYILLYLNFSFISLFYQKQSLKLDQDMGARSPPLKSLNYLSNLAIFALFER